jgi:Domain of unknown function (DUF4157)
MRTFAQRENRPQPRVSFGRDRGHLTTPGEGLQQQPVLRLFPPMVPAFQFNFSRIPLNPPAIRRKPIFSSPGDRFEREADEVGEAVMRMHEPARGTIPMQPAGSGDLDKAAVPRDVHEVLRSPGQALGPSTRDFFEPRFGYDFGRVRVHADDRAAESARALNAIAYTVGEHIVFSPGQYEPNTRPGRRLLAHELTHTIQSAASPWVVWRQPRTAKQEAVHSSDKPEWDLQPTYQPNRFYLRFSQFLFQHEILRLLFKDGKLPPGYLLEGDGNPNTRWYLTVPPNPSLDLFAVPIASRLVQVYKDQAMENIERIEANYGRLQLDKFIYRTYEGDISLGGAGFFHAKYDPPEGTLTISVPIRFNFKDSDEETTRFEGDPKGNKPVTIIKQKEYKRWSSKEIENYREEFIKVVQDTWSSKGTQHIIYCHKPGWEGLGAKVIVKVDEIGETTSGPFFTANVYRGEASGDQCGRGGGGFMECVRKGYASLQYSDVKGDVHTAVHEFGHMLGLGDEYKDVYKDVNKPEATEASHSGLVNAEFGYGVPRLDDPRTDPSSESIMSGGGKVLPEHGVVFLEAIRQITGIQEWHLKPKTHRTVRL